MLGESYLSFREKNHGEKKDLSPHVVGKASADELLSTTTVLVQPQASSIK